MTTGPPDPALGPGAELLTIGPAGPQQTWSGARRIALFSGLGLLSAVVLGLVSFTIYGLFVGGSATAQGAANAVVSNLNSRDLRGLYQLLDPHEREAYARAATGLTANARHLGLGGAGKPSDQTDSSDQPSLDGIDLRLTGVEPTVRKLAPDVALLQYATGEVTATVRPAEATGLVRLGLDAARIIAPVTRTKPVAELVGPTYTGAGPGPGLGLIAVRSGLRWYVSPVASAAWISRVSSGEIGAQDVRLTPTRSRGSASASEAAAASVTTGLISAGNGDLAPFGATLVRSEQVATEIYAAEPGEATEVSEADGVQVKAAQFVDGPREGSRQLAYLEKLDARGLDEPLRGNSTCISSGSIKACATDPSYGAVGPSFVRFFTSEGQLALTARTVRGGWKVSLADTLADGIVSWSAGLTREQAVSVFGLAHLEPTGGPIPVGRSKVTYNSAGYAVRTLTVDRSGRFVFAGPGNDYFRVEIRPAAGGAQVEATYDGEIEPTYYGESYRLSAGDYVVVLWSVGAPAAGGRDHTEPVVITRVPD